MLEPAAKPQYRAGDDARVQLRRMEAYGDENAARLKRSRVIYRGVRQSYGAK